VDLESVILEDHSGLCRVSWGGGISFIGVRVSDPGIIRENPSPRLCPVRDPRGIDDVFQKRNSPKFKQMEQDLKSDVVVAIS
jgi:hypothetical protein